MLKLTKILFFILIVSNFAFAQNKEEAFNKLKTKLSNVKSISFSFDENGNKGSIKAAKGNKFIIIAGDRKIISNGKDLWNYSTAEKKVMLSEYENSSSMANLDDIFMNFSTAFKPLSLIKENASNGGSSNVLILQNNDGKSLKNISEIKIYSQGNFDDFSAIEIKSKSGTKKFGIKNLQINPKMKDSQFNFEVPKGVELIDLR
jgi:outer membrane lipoprotein-sorting protein